MLCDHLGWTDAGDLLRSAVRAAVREHWTTRDIGGSRSTREVGDWLLEHVSTQSSLSPGSS
jgi:isocitrate/isopropylmalate dehydrogenase